MRLLGRELNLLSSEQALQAPCLGQPCPEHPGTCHSTFSSVQRQNLSRYYVHRTHHQIWMTANRIPLCLTPMAVHFPLQIQAKNLLKKSTICDQIWTEERISQNRKHATPISLTKLKKLICLINRLKATL